MFLQFSETPITEKTRSNWLLPAQRHFASESYFKMAF